MKHHGILGAITTDDALVQRIRQGDLRAFDKLNLSFHQLYAETDGEGSVAEACGISCVATCAITPFTET